MAKTCFGEPWKTFMVDLVRASTMLVSVMACVGEVLASQEAGCGGSGDFFEQH